VASFARASHNGAVAKTFELIDDQLSEWLVGQPIFFVSTAPLASDGFLNCSPKGNRQEFAVLGPRTVAYLDQTGSGVETIAHLKENGRIVVMFCAFSGPPRIVRLHGTGRAVLKDSPEFETLADQFAGVESVGVRSVIVVEVERISDSCGYGVPFMNFDDHRPTMDQWANRKGLSGIRDYWTEKNRRSIDNLEGFDV
jgi:Pyridoxamine 5'-phosphate oxidase